VISVLPVSAVLANGSGEKRTVTWRKNRHGTKSSSILSRQQRDIAEREAKLLSRLSHPSIIKIVMTRPTVPAAAVCEKRQ
jgi:hypothetical protein